MGQQKDTSKVIRQIDENLKRVYREAEKDDVPDRFKELLEKLRQQDEQNE